MASRSNGEAARIAATQSSGLQDNGLQIGPNLLLTVRVLEHFNRTQRIDSGDIAQKCGWKQRTTVFAHYHQGSALLFLDMTK